MITPAPEHLLQTAAAWSDLHRWERAELGRALRRLGWTYGEIRRLIPVPKGTLSYWCRDVTLTAEQIVAIKDRSRSRLGVPVDTQWKRRLEIEQIEVAAKAEVPKLIKEPLWVAGTVLYWAEGSKTTRTVELANSDPSALRLFMSWVRRYRAADSEFVASVNLHADNDEPAARRFWSDQLAVDQQDFTKTFVKPDGTGHRKNHLPHGVCRLRVRRSTDSWIRAMAWIEELGAQGWR